MAVVNLEIVRPGIKDLIRKDFTAAAALVEPNQTNPLFDGEWVQLDSSYNAVRFVDDGDHRDAGNQNAGLVISYPVWAERGRYDVQALKKIPVLFGNTCELDCKIFDNTGLFIGCEVEVADMTYATLTKRGLRLKNTGFAVGYVTRIFSDKVRILRTCC